VVQWFQRSPVTLGRIPLSLSREVLGEMLCKIERMTGK
jgi:hypothetical protein